MSFKHLYRFKRPGISVAVTLATIAGNAHAELIHRMDQVVVTAARRAETVDETLAPVTIINRQEIERSQVTSVTELLSQVPGVQIASNGGLGSKSGVFIRGTSTEQTLILMDGQKINTAQAGAAPLEYLDPDQIERIEVVRGPRSTLYGADAVGGVINIITRKGAGTPGFTFKAGGGSRKTGEYSANFGGESGSTRFNIGARLFETAGYDRTATRVGFDGDDDAFRNKSASASLSHDFGHISTGVNISHTQGKAEYDVNWPTSPQGLPISNFELTNINTFVTANINNVWASRLEIGALRDGLEDEGPSPSHAINKRYSVSWVNELAWADNQFLITGFDYADDHTVTSYQYTADERNNTGIFAQNLTSFNTSELQLGARYDNNEAHGGKTTGQVSWGFQLARQLRLVASYGTAFRAPTFMNLYSVPSGDPDLNPETAKNAEIELRGQLNNESHWSINVYHNDIDDLIIYSEGKMRNVEKARIQGIEFATTTRIQDWDINASFSLLNPENRTLGTWLVRRSRQLFAVRTDKEFGRWSLGGTFRGQGSAWDSTDNKTKKISGFGTVDLRASFSIAEDLKTQLKVVNLLDKEYSTAEGYIDEPRGVFATLIWSPKL